MPCFARGGYASLALTEGAFFDRFPGSEASSSENLGAAREAWLTRNGRRLAWLGGLAALFAAACACGAVAWSSAEGQALRGLAPSTSGPSSEKWGIFGWPAPITTTSTATTTTTTTSRTRTSTTITTTAIRPQSLYCFAVARPPIGDIDEYRLMKLHAKHETGIFGCDAHTIFTNVTSKFSRDLGAELVDGSLLAPIGGFYHMALNTEIFIDIWKKVFADGVYEKHDWTVKVDPDAVFLPRRLRELTALEEVREAAKRESGVYLNNCRIGNHGPVEVISTAGVTAMASGLDKCIEANVAPFTDVGEDVFVRRCLEHSGVEKMDEFKLLSEINCFENPNPCKAHRVAFHPFKHEVDFMKCLEETSGETPPPPPPRPAGRCYDYGCSADYVAGRSCQCTPDCNHFNNCCSDYDAECKQNSAEANHAAVMSMKQKKKLLQKK